MMTPLPTPPQRSDPPATFVSRADALMAALAVFVTEANALQTDVIARQGQASGAQTASAASEVLAFNHAIAAAASAAQALSGATAAAWVQALFASGISTRSGYLYAWQDGAGRLLLGIKNDGSLWSDGINVSATIATAAVVLPGAAAVSLLSSRNYLHVFTEANNRILGGFLANGQLEINGVNLSALTAQLQADGQTQLAALTPLLPLQTFAGTPATIYAWGDSLTFLGSQGTGILTGWMVLLAAALGRVFNNRGIGGQIAEQIIGRQGSYLVTVTVTGNQLPAAGSVNVTLSNPVLSLVDGGFTAACSVNGVAGILSMTGAQYVFTRTTAGAAVTVWPGTTLEMTVAAEARFCTNIIWVGRNNITQGEQTVAGYEAQSVIVLDAIDKAVRSLNPLNPRFLVLGITNGQPGGLPAETIGTAAYAAILSLNTRIQARYPARFIDIRRILLESGTGAGQDAIDYANGLIPVSLRSDGIHLSAAGNAVVAAAVQSKLNQQGI